MLDTLGSVTGPSLWTWLAVQVTEASSSPSALTEDGLGGLRFTAYRPDIGWEPWLIDADGLRLMEDTIPGSDGLRPLEYLVHRGRTLMLPGSATGADDEPYVWDGSSVQQIDLLATGDSDPSGLVPLGDVVLTRADNPSGDSVLWAIDPVTLTFEDLLDSAVLPYFPVLAAGDTAFFFVNQDLWKTDGTAAGTELIETVGVTEGAAAVLREGSAGTPPLIVFLVYEPLTPGLSVLWASDGTPQGTLQLATGFGFETNNSVSLVRSGSEALLITQPFGSSTFELFVTDGTVPGTSQVSDRAAGGDFGDSAPHVLGSVPGGWYYSDRRDATGAELWITDGSTTTMLEINPGPMGSLRGTASGSSRGGNRPASLLCIHQRARLRALVVQREPRRNVGARRGLAGTRGTGGRAGGVRRSRLLRRRGADRRPGVVVLGTTAFWRRIRKRRYHGVVAVDALMGMSSGARLVQVPGLRTLECSRQQPF